MLKLLHCAAVVKYPREENGGNFPEKQGRSVICEGKKFVLEKIIKEARTVFSLESDLCC